MAESDVIVPERPANKGLDYYWLREEGIRVIQELSGDIWTDYNEHDPGVTTLEQLCYALTELSYRAEFPMEDLLLDERSGRIEARRQALFIARRIFPCNPLTIGDYRKLLVDRVPGLANAWLTLWRGRKDARAVDGLYDIWLYAPAADPCRTDAEGQPEAIRRRARRVYSRHRCLCEDVHSIRLLEPLTTVVSGAAEIGESLTPEAVLAGMFFNLGNFLAPELRRRPLKDLLDRGQTPAEIFTGPLLRRGFIDNRQLQPKACVVSVQEIIRVMARSPGVQSVRDVEVQVGDQSGSSQYCIPTDRFLALDTRPNFDGGFSIRMFKNGIELRPNPARVERELQKRWAEYRRTYNLNAQYREYLAMPEGRRRDLRQYYSVQNQYPAVYGINEYGVAGDASQLRHAQAKQLKGYLLAFEQLLADFFAQLARAKDLYSIDPRLRRTYFYQYLTRSVPNVGPLLKKDGEDDYRRGLPRIVASHDAFVERRNLFLDLLLALYAETLDESSVWNLTARGATDADSGTRLIRSKLALLRRLVESARDRGRGFDYLAPPSRRNVAGMTIKSRIQLGISVFDRGSFSETLEEFSLQLAEPDAKGSPGGSLARHASHIEENFGAVAPAGKRLTAAGLKFDLRRQFAPLSGGAVSPGFVRAAGRIEHFRVGTFPGEDVHAVVCKSPEDDEWRLVGKFQDEESACEAACCLAELMGRLRRRCRQLYIVEHNLLRWGRRRKAPSEEEPEGRHRPHRPFVYSFTVTAVVSAGPDLYRSRDFRTFAREVIRANTPAHVVVDYCFLSPWGLLHFERLYWAWRRALRERRRGSIRIASFRLRHFLQRCRRR